MDVRLGQERFLSGLSRAAVAMVFFSYLVWRFEPPPFAPHLVEAMLVGVATAIGSGLQPRSSTLSERTRVAQVVGFWLLVVIIPVLFLLFWK